MEKDREREGGERDGGRERDREGKKVKKEISISPNSPTQRGKKKKIDNRLISR